MSGPDLQEELRREDRPIPIIFITAHGDEAIRSRLVESWRRGVSLQAIQRHGVARGDRARAARKVITPCSHKRSRVERTLPTPPAQLPVSRASPRRMATAVVLVVDDDASVRKSLQLLDLESAGWHAETLASAREFLSGPPVEPRPSCLVLDVKLPGSGWA